MRSNCPASVVERCVPPSKTDLNLPLHDEGLFCECSIPMVTNINPRNRVRNEFHPMSFNGWWSDGLGKQCLWPSYINSIRMFAAWFPPQETASNSSSGNVATFFLQELFWLDLENNCSLRPSARPPVPKAGLQPKHTEQKSLDNMMRPTQHWFLTNTVPKIQRFESQNAVIFANAHKLFEHADQINRFLFWILWFTNCDILEILQSAPILARCVVKSFWRTCGKQIEVSSTKILPHIERFLPHIEHFDQSNRNNIDRWANWCETVWRKTDLHPL